MNSYSSIDSMLNDMFQNMYDEFIGELITEGYTGECRDDLEITTTCCGLGRDLIFAYNELNIDLNSIHMVISTLIWDDIEDVVKSEIKDDVNIYYQITKNIKWHQIDYYVKNNIELKLKPISIISLDNTSESVDLKEIIEHVDWEFESINLILVISKIGDENTLMEEVNEAKDIFKQRVNVQKEDDFKIETDRGDLIGFCSIFKRGA